jgi:hypothetical protein
MLYVGKRSQIKSMNEQFKKGKHPYYFILHMIYYTCNYKLGATHINNSLSTD